MGSYCIKFLWLAKGCLFQMAAQYKLLRIRETSLSFVFKLLKYNTLSLKCTKKHVFSIIKNPFKCRSHTHSVHKKGKFSFVSYINTPVHISIIFYNIDCKEPFIGEGYLNIRDRASLNRWGYM